MFLVFAKRIVDANFELIPVSFLIPAHQQKRGCAPIAMTPFSALDVQDFSEHLDENEETKACARSCDMALPVPQCENNFPIFLRLLFEISHTSTCESNPTVSLYLTSPGFVVDEEARCTTRSSKRWRCRRSLPAGRDENQHMLCRGRVIGTGGSISWEMPVLSCLSVILSSFLTFSVFLSVFLTFSHYFSLSPFSSPPPPSYSPTNLSHDIYPWMPPHTYAQLLMDRKGSRDDLRHVRPRTSPSLAAHQTCQAGDGHG